MKSVKWLILVLVVGWMILGTPLAQAAAYHIIYFDLHDVGCSKGVDPFHVGPYEAYFDVQIDQTYPAGAMIHTITIVNGSIIPAPSGGWTTAPSDASYIGGGEIIYSPTNNYSAKKVIELWVDGTLRSRTAIVVTCTDKLTGTRGPYGSIVEADIF